jgi:hypothetical protein
MVPMRVNGQEIVKAEAESVLRILGGARQPDVVGTIVHDAHSHAEWLTDGAKRLIPPGPIACRERCSFCCHLRVVTTIPEVIQIATQVQSMNGSDGTDALRHRVAQYRNATSGLDADARRRLRIACPLLVDGLCTVYPVRPLSCRGWNSLDVSGCEAHFLDPARGIRIPVYGPQQQINAFVQDGIGRGLREAGLQHDRVELGEALKVGLEIADVAERWLRGERLFTAALE